MRIQAPELRRPWPPSHVRANRSAFAWALRPLGAIPKPRWRRDSSYVRSVVQRGAFAAASAAAARRTSSHAPQPLTERWCASSATMQAAVLQPRPSRGAARRIGKHSTANSAALGGGGQPAHPLPPSSRTAAFRGSLRATRAPRSAAVGQPFLLETIFGLRAPSRPRARVVFLGGLERSLALLAPSSRRL